MEHLLNLKRRLELGHEINHGDLSMSVEGNRIMMTGGRYGNHDIIRSSDEHRIRAHWMGYITNNEEESA